MTVEVGIDGDIIVYSCGFAAEGEPVENCLHSVKKMVEGIVNATSATSHTIYLTGSNNFRKEVATIQEYKGNRKDTPKPTHYQAIRDYLIDVHKAELIEDMEADDALAIAAHASTADTYVIATIDKDLDMVEGWHYNWRRDELYEVGKEEGMRNFYKQLLTGDSSDNIPGLFKLTGKKALKKIKDPIEVMDEEIDMWNHVYSVYTDAYNSNGMLCDLADEVVRDWLREIGQLLWMKTTPEDTWTPPDERVNNNQEV